MRNLLATTSVALLKLSSDMTTLPTVYKPFTKICFPLLKHLKIFSAIPKRATKRNLKETLALPPLPSQFARNNGNGNLDTLKPHYAMSAPHQSPFLLLKNQKKTLQPAIPSPKHLRIQEMMEVKFLMLEQVCDILKLTTPRISLLAGHLSPTSLFTHLESAL